MPPAPEDDATAIRLAVISDIHGNAPAYREALRLARRRGFDQLVILGDLLTYGCEPLAVLELTQEAVARDRAVLIKGNHDQLYFDLAVGERGYHDSLPGWLRETVDWTEAVVAGVDLAGAFPWLARYAAGDLLFAHANPFACGDWTYLNAPADIARAGQALGHRQAWVGVFGHTHRAKLALLGPGEELRLSTPAAGERLELRCDLGSGGPHAVIANAGSVGQPRDEAKTSTLLFLSRTTRRLELEHARVIYDLDAHKRGIMTAALSAATKAKLLGFFP
jgi:predicted phosphodiesterase